MVSVFTPKHNITACELMADAKHVVLALEGCQQLVTLKLVGPETEPETPEQEDQEQDDEIYGLAENRAKVFELSESDVC